MNLNFVTLLALLSWPIVAVFLYKTRPVEQATLWTILGAYMFLPVGATIKFTMIPQFDKNSIPNIAAFLGCMLVVRKRISLSNGFGLAELFIVALLVGPFITSALNGDDILIGDRILPGVGIYDPGSQ